MRKIAADKWKHFTTGIVMGIVLQAIAFYFLPGNLVKSCLIVFVLIVCISYGFELFSKLTGKGHHEINDAIASILGGVLGMLMMLLYMLSMK